VVDQLDLGPFLRGYRADGHSHPAYDPKTLLGVLLYGYAIGVRSSRQIERRCHAQVVAAPDQATSGQPGDHLSHNPGRHAASTASAVHPPGAAPATLPRPRGR
jgi:hypothetical protein